MNTHTIESATVKFAALSRSVIAAFESFGRFNRVLIARELKSWHRRYRRHYWMGRQTGMRPHDAITATLWRYFNGVRIL